MNVLIGLIHDKDKSPNINKKVMQLIENWGQRFERDHDILPLFSDVYNAMKAKGYFSSDGKPQVVQQKQQQ